MYLPTLGGSCRPTPSCRPTTSNCTPSDTKIQLGLDAVGFAASLTGLKSAWMVGSAAVGATTAMLSVTQSGISGNNQSQAWAVGGATYGIGGSLVDLGASRTASQVAEALPVAGATVSGANLASDLADTGCF